MKIQKQPLAANFDELDCFGNYHKANPLCAKSCAIRLRCAIEQVQNLRMELMEDLVTVEGAFVKIQ